MPIIRSRTQIPDEWGQHAICPLCQTRTLKVLHQPESPDCFKCTQCGLSFEIEQGGDRINVVRWPTPLASLMDLSEDRWMKIDEIKALLQQPAQSPVSPAKPNPVSITSAPSQPSMSRDELIVRVKKLRDLGNPDKKIQVILLQAGAKPEQVQEAISLAIAVKEIELSRQQNKLWLSLGIVGLLLVVSIGLGIKWVRSIPVQQGQNAAPVQTLLMPGLAEALSLDTPVVQFFNPDPNYDPSTSGCPHSAAEAAALFGGKAANWTSPPNSNGWQMIDTGSGNSIFLPQNMKALFLDLSSDSSIVEVEGPASLSNVRLIAITCP